MNRPAWLRDAVFYGIYPSSFCDSNADGMGISTASGRSSPT